MFINLRNYSENSILNATTKAAKIVEKAKEIWLDKVALTDKTAYWMVKFYLSCKENNLKPLYGFNLKLKDINNSQHNILIFPKSEQWQKNMFTIVSDNNIENIKTLKDYEDESIFEDIILIVNYNTYIEHKEEYDNLPIKDLYIELQPRNTKEEYDNLKSLVWIEKIIITSPMYYLNKVAFKNTEKYIDQDGVEQEQVVFELTGWEMIKIMKSIETWIEVWEIEWEFEDFHFKTEEEIRNNFSYIEDIDFNKILENINFIVDNINFYLELNEYQIPVFELDKEDNELFEKNKKEWNYISSNEWFFRYIAYKHLEELYNIKMSEEDVIEFANKEFDPNTDKALKEYSNEELENLSLSHFSNKKKEKYDSLTEEQKTIIKRIEFEFFIIHKMWFDAYFLIVLDYIAWARNNWIIVWRWRWSVAWSILAYLTRISNVDPIKYWLLFFRFISPFKISMPDIDTDFSDRDAVIKYCADKYWKENVTPIITFGKLTSKSVLKNVWKAEWISFSEMNNISKMIVGKEANDSLEKIYENNQAFKNVIDSSTEYTNVFWISKQLYWLKAQTGKHACATLVAKKPVINYCPIQYPTDKKWVIKDKSVYVTQLEWPDLETLWLLKMDFLGLNTLTIMKNTLNIIKEVHWIDIDIQKVPIDDPLVYDTVFKTWNTTNVFQFESYWMKKYLKWLEADNIEELIAMVSLYRPWPMKFIDDYIQVKKWLKEPTYKDEGLKDLLDPTNWVCIYQEQIMIMAQILAWYGMWEADLLRRAIWKKKKEIIIEQREVFCKKGEELGKDPIVLWEIYDEVVLPAAEYSFNKSHAACYAFIAYETAYLKTYYNTEFTVWVLQSEHWEDLDRVKITLEDAMLAWITVLPVNINTSEIDYMYRDKNLLEMWLKTIKWVWIKSLEWIIEERNNNGKFKDFNDFVERNINNLDKKVLNWLLSSWALSDLIETKLGFENIENILKYKKDKNKKPTKRKSKKEEVNILDIFNIAEESFDNENTLKFNLIEKDNIKPYNKLELAILEEESVGLNLKYNPFDNIWECLDKEWIWIEQLYSKVVNKYRKKEDKQISLYAILRDSSEKLNSLNEKNAILTLQGKDFIIKWNIDKVLYYNNMWKIKNNINNLVKVQWYISITEYWKTLYINKISFEDYDKIYNKLVYEWLTNDKKYNYVDILRFKEEEKEVYEEYNVFIKEEFLKWTLIENLKQQLSDFKKYLLKLEEKNWYYRIVLKSGNDIKDTNIHISKENLTLLKEKVSDFIALYIRWQ